MVVKIPQTMVAMGTVMTMVVAGLQLGGEDEEDVKRLVPSLPRQLLIQHF